MTPEPWSWGCWATSLPLSHWDQGSRIPPIIQLLMPGCKTAVIPSAKWLNLVWASNSSSQMQYTQLHCFIFPTFPVITYNKSPSSPFPSLHCIEYFHAACHHFSLSSVCVCVCVCKQAVEWKLWLFINPQISQKSGWQCHHQPLYVSNETLHVCSESSPFKDFWCSRWKSQPFITCISISFITNLQQSTGNGRELIKNNGY